MRRRREWAKRPDHSGEAALVQTRAGPDLASAIPARETAGESNGVGPLWQTAGAPAVTQEQAGCSGPVRRPQGWPRAVDWASPASSVNDRTKTDLEQALKAARHTGSARRPTVEWRVSDPSATNLKAPRTAVTADRARDARPAPPLPSSSRCLFHASDACPVLPGPRNGSAPAARQARLVRHCASRASHAPGGEAAPIDHVARDQHVRRERPRGENRPS